MKISIIVITLNEERNIKDCLETMLKLDYKDFEVLVVDGGSKDKTQDIVKKYHKKDKRIRLVIDKGKGTITTSRNAGIKAAKYDYIAFTDADCMVPKNWLTIMTKRFKHHDKRVKLAGVGGSNVPPKATNLFTKALGIAFDSWLGSLGSIQATPFYCDKVAFSISCSNSLYRKKALLDVKMFSEDLDNQGEDWDMGLKLQKQGYTVIGLKDSFVWHKMRATPRTFWKNMVFYGDGRMRLTKKHPGDIKIKYVLPLIFIVGMASVVLSLFWSVFLLPLLYFPFILLYSGVLCLRKGDILMWPVVFYAFILQHFGYAYGEVKGIRWFLK